MSTKLREYASESIRVLYDHRRCIHAEECVHGLPDVFDPERRPWIDPERADPDAIAQVVLRCPTGALQFERLDGGEAEPVPTTNIATVDPDGPLYVRGDVEIRSADGSTLHRDTRVALCRCGASKNKPFCDGAHTEVGFRDPGQVEPGDEPDAVTEPGPVLITVAAKGPLLMQGPYRVTGRDTGSTALKVKGALCRCGQSARKPFCDGTHNRVGFTG